MRKALKGFERDGYEATLSLLADDFELTTPSGLGAEPDTYRGQEGMRRYWESFYDAMEEVQFEAKEFLEGEDWVIVPFTMTARGRSTGIEAGLDAVAAWRWRDGKAVRALAFADLDEAMAAIPPSD